MKIKGTISQEFEKEIELPYYYRYGSTYVKIESEQSEIKVSNYDFSLGIENSFINKSLLALKDSQQCTEAEFNEAFESVINKLSNLQTAHNATF